MKNMSVSIRLLCLSFLSVLCFSVSAQEPYTYKELTLSGVYLQKGLTHYYEEDYEKAIAEFELINKNDTNYSASIVDRASAYLKLEKYDEAAELSIDALDKNYVDRHLHYLNLSASYAGLEKYDDAISLLDEALIEFPYSDRLQLKKVSILLDKGDVEESAALMEKMLYSRYMNQDYHLRAANYAVNEGALTEAFLSYSTYLIIHPGKLRSLAVLKELDDLSLDKAETDPKGFTMSESGDDYDEIDLLIKNRVAVTKKYKTPSKSNLALIQQLHLMMAELQKSDSKGGFYDSYYVPLFNKIMEQDKFAAFSYTLLSSSTNPSHTKLATKYAADVKAFRTWFIKEMHDLYREQQVIVLGQKKKLDVWFGDDGNVVAIGKENSKKNAEGEFYIYHESGALASNGSFDENGKRHEKWTWYYENANLKETAIYKHGDLDGENIGYHENGNVSYEIQYSDDKINGLAVYYDNSGAKSHELTWEKSKLNGPAEYFFKIGKKRLGFSYKDGELDGKYVRYFAHGEIDEKGQFKEGKRVGEFLSYYENGGIHGKFNYKEGLFDGNYEKYYFNGQLYKKGIYSEGSEIGEWFTYNKNGTVSRRFEFDENGKYNGKIEEYDIDGNLVAEKEYKKGVFRAYKEYNRKGELIHEAKIKGKDLNYVGHSPDGIKVTEGHYINDEREGKWTFYYPNGSLKAVEFYAKGELEGEYIEYYESGKIMKRYQYKDGELNSNYVSYYSNGQIEEEGWYHEGELAGEWINYYANGSISDRKYFIDGTQVGEESEYDIVGKLLEVNVKDEGTWIELLQYDTTGQVFNTQIMENGTAPCIYKYADGKQYSKFNYIHGKAHGDFEWYYPNGKTLAKGEYFNSERHGVWTWYHVNGQISTVGEYFYGNRIGDWKEYFDDGTVSETYTYENGNLEGEYVHYFRNGNKSRVDTYYDDTFHGRTTFFVESGEVDHYRYYSEGKIVAYSYIGKDGKEVSKINIVGQTAEVVAYFENGSVSRKYTIKNGLFDGDYTKYYPNGQVKETTAYKDDLEDGVATVYHTNGKVKSEGTYELGRKVGEHTKYHDTGKKKEKKVYIANILHGNKVIYDSNGAVKQILTYYDGKLVEIKNK